MRKMINRMWQYFFHPSMRLYTVPNANAYTNRYPTVWRYPNLGSAAPEELNLYQDEDYKTPYTYSKYNIRHKGLTETQKAEMAKEYIYWADNWYVTPTIKLQKLGYLKPGQENDPEAMKKAEEKYLEVFGISVHKTEYRNDYKADPRPTSREQIGQRFMERLARQNEEGEAGVSVSFDRSSLHNPIIVPVQKIDVDTDPRSQMFRIEHEYVMEKAIRRKLGNGKVPIIKGEARFWKALDETVDPKSIKEVQEHLQDEQPNEFELRHRTIDFTLDQQGSPIAVKPNTGL